MNGATQCGAMLERIQREHHCLNHTLRLIRSRLSQLPAEPQPPGAATDILTMLEQLRGELVAHFAEEESGGCFGEVVMRCPSVAPQVKAVEIEHRELIPTLDALLARAKDEAAPSEQIHSEFEAFARQLHDHEVAESRLLQYALGGEASDFDVEGNE